MLIFKKVPVYPEFYKKSWVLKFITSCRLVWSFCGNQIDTIPPAWHMAYEKEWKRDFIWFFVRNPFHNFCWYVIGFAEEKYNTQGVWNPNGGFNLQVPFISYRGKRIEWYIGWKPDYQGFGMSFRRKQNV